MWLWMMLVACGDGWSDGGTLRVARFGHSATLLADGAVLVVGGYGPSGETLPFAERWDPGERLWSDTGSLTAARAFHAAVPLEDGRVLVIGGEVGGAPVRGTEVYDPDAGTWSPAGDLSRGRFRPAAARLDDGSVLVHGGHVDVAGPGPERWEPSEGVWVELEVDAAPRVGATGLGLGAGLLLAGGVGLDGELARATELVTPGAAGGAGDLLTPRLRAAGAALGEESALLIGGSSDLTASQASALASVELWDGAGWVGWGQLVEPRIAPTATVTRSGAVVVTGGGDGSDGPARDTVELLDPATQLVVEGSPMEDRRVDHAAVLLSDGRILVVAGSNGIGTVSSTEVYRPPARYRR